MNSQPDLRANNDVGQFDEHVEGVGHAAVGRILEGNQSKLNMAAIDT